jgi:hypothetical protein
LLRIGLIRAVISSLLSPMKVPCLRCPDWIKGVCWPVLQHHIKEISVPFQMHYGLVHFGCHLLRSTVICTFSDEFVSPRCRYMFLRASAVKMISSLSSAECHGYPSGATIPSGSRPPLYSARRFFHFRKVSNRLRLNAYFSALKCFRHL